MANHLQDLPELTKAAKVVPVANPTKEALTAAWKEWVEQAGTGMMVLRTCCSVGVFTRGRTVAETGTIPPGNMPGERKWAAKKSQQQAKPEIRLTPGKGLDDVSCSLDELITQVVTTNKVHPWAVVRAILRLMLDVVVWSSIACHLCQPLLAPCTPTHTGGGLYQRHPC